MKKIAALALVLVSTGAVAQVYKCSIGGQVAFSDQPCPGGSAVKVKPAAGYAPPGGRVETGRENKVDPNLIRQGEDAVARMQAEQDALIRRREAQSARDDIARDLNKRTCARARSDVEYYKGATRDSRQYDYINNHERLRQAQDRAFSLCD